jgi:F-type H+-transporting ATPase subunit delta
LIGSKVSKRYAKALFSLGQEDRKIEQYGRELNGFLDIYRSDPEFSRVISTRIFAVEDRKRVLKAVLEKTDLSETVKNFLLLLLEKDRIGTIDGISRHYERLTDEASNIARAEVFAPMPLKADALGRLEKGLEKMTSKRIKLEVREDRSLIGGIVVKVGDLVLDGSVKAQLRGLKESL